jgi:dTDP-4-dehydrorhamnose 3,5-epimerase
VLHGEVFDVAVDVRRGSPTFGRWCAERLRAESGRQLFVPPGFAHGFLVLSDSAVVAYKVTERYHPEAETTVAWNDAEIGIDWPLDGAPALSPKDAAAPTLRACAPERLPTYAPGEAPALGAAAWVAEVGA